MKNKPIRREIQAAETGSLKKTNREKFKKQKFVQRRKGLKKKISELSTLCGIEAGLICYGPGEVQPEIWPENLPDFHSMIRRYQNFKGEKQDSKRNLVLSSFLEADIGKFEEKLNQEKIKNMELVYPSWVDQLDGFSEQKLRELVGFLDVKLETLNRRIQMSRDHVFDEIKDFDFELPFMQFDFPARSLDYSEEMQSFSPLLDNFSFDFDFQRFYNGFHSEFYDHESARRVEESEELKDQDFLELAGLEPLEA